MVENSQQISQIVSELVSTNICNAIGDGISIVDRDFNILYQNTAHKTIFGNHEGETCFTAFAGNSLMCDKCPVAKVFEDSAVHKAEIDISAQKTDMQMEITASPVVDVNGEVIAGLEVVRDITERKQHLQMLQESEEKYRTLFESATDAIFLVDTASHRIADCNQQAVSLTGYPLKELKSMTMKDLHPLDEQDVVSRIFNKLIHQRTLSDITGLHFMTKDGKHIPVEISAGPITIGQRRYSLCFGRNRTERVQAEQELRESEAKYRTLIENMSDALGIQNEKGLLTYVNPRFLKLFGYRKDEIIGLPVTNLMDEKNKKIFIEKMLGRKKGDPKSFELSLNDKKGNRIDAIISPRATYNEAGVYTGAFAVITDITKRKKAETALRASEKKFRAVFETALVGIVVGNEKGELMHINPAFARMLGYSMRELHTRFSDITYKDDIEKNLSLFKEMVEGKRNSYRMEKRYIRKDGSIMWANLWASAVRDADGSFLYNIAMIEDISRRKVIESSLRESEERYRNSIEYANDGYALSEGGKLLHCNRRFSEIFGYGNQREVIGRPITEFVHPEDRSRLTQIHEQRDTLSDIPSRYEFKGIQKNGMPIHVEISSSVISYHDRIVNLAYLRDISNRKKMEEHLKNAAITDILTELYNRRGFLTLADQQIKTARRTKKRLSLLFIDLDGLKGINDSLGHSAGDNALKDTALILQSSFRESDIIGRVGGDEFAVLLTEPPLPGSEHIVISNLDAAVEKHNETSSAEYTVTLSAGMSHCEPGNPCSIDELFTQADRIMYDNKKRRMAMREKEEKERREHARRTPAEDYWAELDSSRVMVKDISLGGIRLQSSKRLKKDTIHEVSFRTSDNGETTPVGIVVWSSSKRVKTESTKETGYESGVKFINLRPQERRSVQNLIDSISG